MIHLSLEEITYFYDSRKCDGLSNINFTLAPGQLCALLGPSGSGKTTLLKLIAGQLRPQKGKLTNQLSGPAALYIPQDNIQHNIQKTDLTLVQYLAQDMKNFDEDLIRDQISFLELSDEFYSPLNSLSLGQWHRAQLAKFFYTDAQLLLLDEPFIHLDPTRRQFIADSLLRLAKENNKIVCWSTHFLDDALLLADKILVLQYGVQQQFDSGSDLYWKPGNLFVAQYFGANNLLMATPHANGPGKFETILGNIDLSGNQQFQKSKEVVLMCRPHLSKVLTTHEKQSIIQDADRWQMILKKISFFGAYQRLEFHYQQTTWWVDIPTTTQINNLEIDQEYCIEIPKSAWSVLINY